MSENSPETSDLSIFSWIIGCAIPINASSVCKYLFDKNNLKPQLKSSLVNCQLYAAALSHVYHSDKAKWRSFSSIYRQLQLYESEDLVDIKSLCDTLEECLSKNAFRQRTHAEFIEHLMRLCMKKLAPFPLLEREIQQLAKGSLELESAINLSNLQQVDANSPDFVKLYGRLLHAWLLAIAWITVPDLTQNLRPEGVHSDEIIQNLGLISLLSCASYYYRSKITTLLPQSSRSTLIKAPCLDTQLAALIERNEPMRRTACLKDDQSNAPRLFAILGGILEQKKVTGGRPEPPHISLITAALCALPHFVGSGEETFSNISALCSSAALFHWFTGSGWPKSTANQLTADEPRLATQKTSSSNQTALRNSVALQSLVRSSGGFAKKARPANPESIPAAVVDLTTVEQLVSSTTGDSLEGIKSPEPVKDEGGLLSELACTAALAFVSSPNISSQSIKIYSKPQSSSQQRQSSGTGNVSTNAFYLSKNHEVAKGVEGVSFTRIPANGTFKMASPSKNLPKSSIPRIDNNLTNKGQKSLSSSPRKGIISTTMPPVGVESSRNGKTNWSELARHQDEEKRSRSIAARPEPTLLTSPTEVDGKSVSGVAALRLSLDQQRRTIEANRQRALRQGGRAAAQRNQAAFKALLHSSQKRRREGTNSEEPPSLAEEEESEASNNKFNDEFTVSQSDIPPEGSVEGEGEEIVPEEVQEGEALSSSSPVAVDAEGTDMDDFSSSVPEQVEIMSNMEPGEFPIQCSSPPAMSSSPPEEDIPTPRVHRRPSPSSTSSPSIPSDELEAEEERRSISRQRNGKNSHSNHHHSRHRENYDQLTSSHHRSESRCSQCSHFTSQSYYDSLPRRRAHGSHSRAYEENENDYEDYYGTLPPRRVTKPPKAARQPARSVKNYRTRGRDYFPEGPEDEEDDFLNETSSEVYWSTHIDRRRTSSNQRHRQRHLDALDSGEEFSYPATGSALPPRPHRLELNYLGKSAGTGLDALVIAELARSVTSLRSDIERLTAQQLSLRSDLREADFSRPVSSVHSSSRLHLANTPSGSTRAMWSSRTPLRYPSQNDVQEKMNLEPEIDREEEADGRALTPSPDHVANENETAIETSSLLKDIKQANIASPAQPKPSEEVPTILAKSLSSEPEIKPAETLFITFENPSSERLQRARERLEARRAADRSRHSESAIRARMADREAQVMAEISAMARNTPLIPADSVVFTDVESENSGFPVHTTDGGDGVLSIGEGNSSTPPKSERPSSARPRQTSAATRKTSAGVTRIPTATAAAGGSGSDRVSRSASLTRSTARGSVTSSSGARPATGSRVTSTNGRRETTSTTRQISTSRSSVGRLSNGPSLSSLHRLENGEESTYSGPGLPIVGNCPQPKLFVKPKSKSNRQVIVNAISHCCLAGTVNEPAKKLALQELAAVDGSHFIVLFRDNRCQYRALYAFDFDTEELKFICGNGPRKITHTMCDKFFKYNSGAKQFSEITSTKHLSAVVDAITIQNSWWLRNPPSHSNAARAAAAANTATSNVPATTVATDSSKS